MRSLGKGGRRGAVVIVRGGILRGGRGPSVGFAAFAAFFKFWSCERVFKRGGGSD